MALSLSAGALISKRIVNKPPISLTKRAVSATMCVKILFAMKGEYPL